jgi:hypothetical protein
MVNADSEALQVFIEASNRWEKSHIQLTPSPLMTEDGAPLTERVAEPPLVQSETPKDGDPQDPPLFLIGLLLPIFSGLVFVSIAIQSHDDYMLHIGDPRFDSYVELDNMTYDVYEITMSGGFSEDFPPDCRDDCWEFLVEVYAPNAYGRGVTGLIWGSSVEPSSSSFDPIVENGNTWYKMDLKYCEENGPEVDCEEGMFIRINTDGTVHIATNYGEPSYIEYAYTSPDIERNLMLRQVFLGFWPILIIVGIVWGRMTGREQFANGLMTGGAVCLALPTLAFINAIFSGGLR